MQYSMKTSCTCNAALLAWLLNKFQPNTKDHTLKLTSQKFIKSCLQKSKKLISGTHNSYIKNILYCQCSHNVAVEVAVNETINYKLNSNVRQKINFVDLPEANNCHELKPCCGKIKYQFFLFTYYN
jgi:hypothetical protein